MSKKIIWSPASEKDFETILEYLQNKWTNRVISKFINKVDEMSNNFNFLTNWNVYNCELNLTKIQN